MGEDLFKIFFGVTLVIVCFKFMMSLQASAENSANTGILSPMKFIHIDGIPNFGSGVEVKLSFTPEQMKIDNTQFIPISKMKGAEINSAKQLTDVQKNVISRAVAGGVLLGGLGSIIGGMSGIGTAQKTETVMLFTVFFTTREGENSVAIFSMQDPMFVGALKNIVNRINNQTGYRPKYLDNAMGEI